MAFTIKELAALSGIKAHTIRIWEQRYNFLKPSRTQTNIRTYSNDELKTILTVSLLNKYGYKISRIGEMDQEQRVRAVLELTHQEAYHEHVVNELIGNMIEMKSFEFEELLNQHISKYGIENTVTGLIFYFLERIGILWQSDKIQPVQEHIVSNIIRQKIISAIEQLPPVNGGSDGSRLFLLFLPEDEHHELGLLFVHYLLKRKNIPVLYLGAHVPLKDIQHAVLVKEPGYLYLHLTSFPRHQQFQKFIATLSSSVPNSKILLSGSAVQHYKKSLPPNVRLLSSFSDVTTYLASLS
jgi:DNA-binding transcriptional MerR regulator